jgi:predicted phage-related endonuclease
MPTVKDVQEVLLSKRNNFLALRWSRDEEIMQRILEFHTSWNNDHIKMNQPDMVYSLETSIDYYLDVPYNIDPHLKPPLK